MADIGARTAKEQGEERSAPSSRIVYHALMTEGRDEMERPSSALFWSGLAAGLSMGFSAVSQALLRAYVPEGQWSPLFVKLGYCVGFLIVILGRQQLFTENTLTVILPLLRERSWSCLRNVLRLWGVVLGANWLGAVLISFALAWTLALQPDAKAALVQIGGEAMHGSFGTVLLRGIFAGWLIALMLWLLPFAETGRIWVIIILSYLVGLGGFSHVVAGSIDALTFAALGRASFLSVLGRYMIPALIGNTIGGVTLVAFLAHAQVVAGATSRELEDL